MPTKSTTGTTGRDTTAEIAYLTRALKAPTLRDAVERLGERARAESWTHEQFLAACLQREVAARESHGGEDRIRAARFPARKFPGRACALGAPWVLVCSPPWTDLRGGSWIPQPYNN